VDAGGVARAVAVAGAVAGLVLMILGVRLLARARAATHWPGPRRLPPVGRRIAGAIVVAGLMLLAGAVPALAEGVVTVSGPPWRPWAVRAALALITLALGGYAVVRLVDRAEMTALIRTPYIPRQSEPQDRRAAQNLRDPTVPDDGQGGWVYRDSAGEWYLAVSVEPGAATGHRLLRLVDFRLAAPGEARPPLYLAGSAQVTVLAPEELPDGPEPAGGEAPDNVAS
jgi:hypothetical protein